MSQRKSALRLAIMLALVFWIRVSTTFSERPVFIPKTIAAEATAHPSLRQSFDGRLAQESTSRENSQPRLAVNAISQFDIHPALEAGLFAAEPMLVNPANIDVDHLGRVWVCEVLNYRGHKNTRPEGDRLLILEDTDGNGSTDKQTVFYQGPDIDSLHGVCVLGDRALVSAGSQVFYLIDTDGDSRADEKEILFTKIGGTQHDHGIHAFVFGPDGKLYFNFGNAGEGICDRNGEPIIDVAGEVVQVGTGPYRQGMVFRCNVDGSQFETLAWNFRNNWEVCVDSFGRMWQSDNDDDGNRAVRINYVMPYGNYGYLDEMTGAGWRQSRTAMADNVPTRHWHQNDPGVIPNLLQTGAGSPTGICVYEGDALPPVFRNQVIHCDAGPNVVRAYPVYPDGAGYSASVVNILDGSRKNQWFRPSDVCVAPDGSLIVADWYDPGVGGHRMGDMERGRLFRITRKGSSQTYEFDLPDYTTVEGSVTALTSPNQATRYLAWRAIRKAGAAAKPALQKLIRTSDNARHQMRGIWAMLELFPDESESSWFRNLLSGDNPELGAGCVRALTQIQPITEFVAGDSIEKLFPDPARQREALIALSHRQIQRTDGESRARIWAALASEYEPGDRWYLEALGIAAERHWNECWTRLAENSSNLETAEIRDIVWRSRADDTPRILANIIIDPAVDSNQVLRFFRALDFQNASLRQDALLKLLHDVVLSDDDLKSRIVFTESVFRLLPKRVDGVIQNKLDDFLAESAEPKEFVRLVDRFDLTTRTDQLIQIALTNSNEQVGVDAMAVLLKQGRTDRLRQLLSGPDQKQFDSLATLMARVGSHDAIQLLLDFVVDPANPVERRKQSTLALGRKVEGAKSLVRYAEGKQYDPQLDPAIRAALHKSSSREINQIAMRLYPLPPSRNKKAPNMTDLLRIAGNVDRGARIFEQSDTCSKCHVVNGKGKDVGPDLSEIGSKLSREALFDSILFPSAGIGDDYGNWLVRTSDGLSFSGLIVSQSVIELQIKDAEGIIRKIPTAEIEEKKRQQLSMMPGDLHKDLTEQDLADLVEYMSSLKK